MGIQAVTPHSRPRALYRCEGRGGPWRNAPAGIFFTGWGWRVVALWMYLLLWGFAAFLAGADTLGQLKFDHLSTTEGLSQVTANCILQDRRGFIWIGTQNGLCRFDGYVFKVFKHDPEDPESLSDNYVWTLCEDHDGQLWVGTYNGGLNRFDPRRERFRHYSGLSPDGNPSRQEPVRAICEDRNGTLWIGTDQGVDHLDNHRESAELYRPDKKFADVLGREMVQCLLLDHAGDLWVGSLRGGLFRRSADGREVGRIPLEALDSPAGGQEDIRALAEDRQGDVWIGTGSGDLFHWDRQTGSVHHEGPEDGFPDEPELDTILSLCVDTAGHLWIGTRSDGLIIMDPRRKRSWHYRSRPGQEKGLNDNTVRALCKDRSGTIWIGTYTHGLNRYNPYRQKFIHYRHLSSDSDGLSHNSIRTFCEDRQGRLWIGTDDGGLDMFDRSTGRFVHYHHDPNDPASLGHDSVRAVCQDAGGILWIGTLQGLYRLDPESGRLIVSGRVAEIVRALADDSIRSLLVDREGDVWVGTVNDGLVRLNPRTGILLRYRHEPGNPRSLVQNSIYCLFEDREGNLWVGTGGGLGRFDSRRTGFQNYVQDQSSPNALSYNLVTVIHQDGTGSMWIGTWGGGLNLLDRATGRFTHYTERNGLPSNAISGILEDRPGDFWISTINGISHFNPRQDRVWNYNELDGLQDKGFNAGAYLKTTGGEMVFGGINGFNIFTPGQIRKNFHVPAIVLTSFRKFGRDVSTGISVSELKRIELFPGDSFFSFEFAALDTASPSRNQYAYKLEGFDPDWIYCGSRRYASYTNLDGGRYVFRVMGSNNDGVWNEDGLSVEVIVHPPFWRTNWFVGVISGIFLLGVYGFIRIRTRGLERHRRLLSEQVTRRTRQLEKQKQELERINLELEKLSLVASESDNAVILAGPGGEIEWVNEGFTRMTGLTLSELIAERGRTLAEASVNPDFTSILKESLEQKRSVVYESMITTKNGQERWVASTLTPIVDRNGQLQKIVIIDADITAHKDVEKELIKTSREAEQASRSKSRFLANVSHEIRTPMNGILGMTELALETDLSPEQREYLELVKSSAESLLNIINDILDFSRIEAGRLGLEEIEFSLRTCVGDTIKAQRYRADNKQLDLELEIDPEIPDLLLGDPGRLRQILVNLIDNAIKFTRQGRILVQVQVEAERADELLLKFAVTDTGPGVPPDKQHLIFNAFEQVDSSSTRRYGGAGLGLSISAQLIRLMGGDIWVESPARLPERTVGGPGTIFHFTVCLRIFREMPLQEETPAPEGLQGLKVLIVDDNPVARRSLSELMAGWGMEPVVAETGAEALAWLRAGDRSANPCAVVLLDSRLSREDGFQVARQIRGIPEMARLPIVMLAAPGHRGDLELCRALGINGYLPKPLHPDEILKMIQTMIGGAVGTVSTPEVVTRHTIKERQKRLKVLLAEDNEVSQKLLKRLLQKWGHQVLVAANGREVLDILGDETVDLVVMDLQMPEMDGLECARRIRQREIDSAGHLPIIALTAHARESDADQCLAAGMDAYVPKPVRAQQLYDLIELVVERMDQ